MPHNGCGFAASAIVNAAVKTRTDQPKAAYVKNQRRWWGLVSCLQSHDNNYIQLTSSGWRERRVRDVTGCSRPLHHWDTGTDTLPLCRRNNCTQAKMAAAAASGAAAAAAAAAGAGDVAREHGNAALRGGDFVAAVAAYTKAIAAEPRDPRAWNNRAQAHLKAGNLLYAYCDAYHVAHGLEPGNGKVRCRPHGATRPLHPSGDPTPSHTPHPHPAYPQAWFRLGLANAEMGRHAAAKACHTEAARVMTDAGMKKEATAHAVAAKRACGKPDRGPEVSFLVGEADIPLPGTVPMPTAYRAGPGGPRHPDAVRAAMSAALSTDAVELVELPGRGMSVVARRDLAAGTVVHIEMPLVAAATPDASGGAWCHHCLRPIAPPVIGVPCTCGVVFCSAACQTTAVKRYHGATCRAGGGGAEAAVRAAAARDPVHAPAGLLLPWKLLGWALTAAAAAGTPPLSPADLPPFCHLQRVSDAPAPPAVDTGRYPAVAGMAAAWSVFYDALGADAAALAHLHPAWMLEVAAMVAGNSFGLDGVDCAAAAPAATALFGAASYFNHSCTANIAYRNSLAATGAVLTFTTTRTVAAGSELTVAYGNDPAVRPQLFKQYGFQCGCVECRTEAWLRWLRAPSTPTPQQQRTGTGPMTHDDATAEVDALTMVIEINPLHPELWLARYRAAASLGDGGALRAYCDAYHVALQLDPCNPAGWVALAGAPEALAQDAKIKGFWFDVATTLVQRSGALTKEEVQEAAMSMALRWLGAPGMHPLRYRRSCSPGPGWLPVPASFRAGPDGPRHPGTVLTAVAGTRSTDWVRFGTVPGKGIGVVAARDIPAGTLVHLEHPLIAATLPPPGTLTCYHCTSRVTAATAVRCARDRLFCTAKCKTDALRSYHAGTCGRGGTVDTMLEVVARADPEWGVRTVLLTWKLLLWALATMRLTGVRVRSPLDLPPFCHMDRATDLPAPSPPSPTPPPSSAPAAAAAAAAAPGRVYANANSLMFIWGLLHDQFAEDDVVASMPPEWLMDAMTVIDTNAATFHHDDDTKRVVVLTAGGSCFNHSCTPNADRMFEKFDPAHPRGLMVVTNRAVAAGEEVTVAYYPDKEYSQVRARSEPLHGFVCTCSRCLVAERDAAARGGGAPATTWTAPSRRALPPLPVVPVAPAAAAAAAAARHYQDDVS